MNSILVAPDSFKGTFSSVEVSQYISAGIRAEGLTAIECPLADGGEGTLDVVLLALKGERHSQSVHGPLGQQVVARWGWVAEQRLAIIEVAQVCGLQFSGRTPTDAIRASTQGVGELLITAAEFGAERIVVATGGSATTDGGQGAIDSLKGNEKALAGISVEVLSDVTVNFEDAATIFAPQKGADPTTVDLLNKRHRRCGRSVCEEIRARPTWLGADRGGRRTLRGAVGRARCHLVFRGRLHS